LLHHIISVRQANAISGLLRTAKLNRDGVARRNRLQEARVLTACAYSSTAVKYSSGHEPPQQEMTPIPALIDRFRLRVTTFQG
jgi:hypothetical protein